MHITPSEAEKYSKKIGDEFHIEVNLEENDNALRFVRGRYEARGNTAIYLEGQDILDLLELNGILGEGGAVKKILNTPHIEKDDQIHDLIYTTLAKYVIQMLNAASAKVLFPEIKPLPKHGNIYFKNE